MKEVLCDIAPTNSCHLLLRWVWLHFKTLNHDERSLYLRHEGNEIVLTRPKVVGHKSLGGFGWLMSVLLLSLLGNSGWSR